MIVTYYPTAQEAFLWGGDSILHLKDKLGMFQADWKNHGKTDSI
jgi:hypothetical protein